MTRYSVLLALVLGLAGCDAMTAHTDVVARVGPHELTITEAAELMAANPQIPAQAEVVGTVADFWVDYTILAELMAEDTSLTGVELEPMLQPYVERRVFEELRQRVMTADTAIAEDELARLYEEQAPGTRIRARHILLSVPGGADPGTRDSIQALAEELQERAAGGEDFAELAQEYSEDPGSGRRGGDLGWFERGRMVQPFEEAAFALDPGEVSEVVETPFGLHIIKLEERESPELNPERAAEFRQQVIGQRQQESISEYVDALREPLNLEVQSGATDVLRGLADDPSEQLTGRAGSRELVTWDGGALTAREAVSVIRRMPPQQRAQFASAPEEPIEGMLRDLATNELVLADAAERGITIPETEQDSVRELIRERLVGVASEAGLVGSPQEGETEVEAVERRVESLLSGILSGRRNILALGALPFVLRDELEWQIHQRTFPEVVEEIQERRADAAAEAPGAPQGITPMPTPVDTASPDTAG